MPGENEANKTTKSFRQRLLDGDRLIGTIVTVPSPSVAEMLSDIGFDWLFIDAEHAPLSTGDIQMILQATRDKCPCIVRIPSHDEIFVKQVLDIGAAGIIAPLVNTAEIAQRIASSAKYPPIGTRSVGIARAHGYGRNFVHYVESANQDITVIVQVEHVVAARNIKSILEVEGVDAIFVGPYDLSGSLGKPGKISEPEVEEYISRVRAACRTAGKPIGIFGVDATAVKPFIDQGYSLVVVGMDTLFLARSAEQTLAELKGGNV
jgi:2-dehydro-3-deoxyglucarate aldolase/4-hydroxy-2-oxoheptanedioate aldolase